MHKYRANEMEALATAHLWVSQLRNPALAHGRGTLIRRFHDAMKMVAYWRAMGHVAKLGLPK